MQTLPRPLLVDRVHEYLVGQLAAKRLPLGSHLNAERVASSLGASRTTVNKAISRLIDDGYVRPDINRRPIVSAYPPEHLAPTEPSFAFANQTERTYEAILARLQRGDLAPGESLKESRLARELGVNAVTVHRAAEWLCNDGVLIRLRRRGWQVVKLGLDELDDVFRIRQLLEPLAIRYAVLLMPQEALDELDALTARMLATGDQAEAFERRQADFDFHRGLAVASGHHILVETLEPLIRKLLMLTIAENRGDGPGTVHDDWQEHQAILEALRQRDEAEAIRAMKTHLRNAQHRIASRWERRANGQHHPAHSPSQAG